MKKSLFLVIFMCNITILFAQNHQITFTGSGLSTSVSSVSVWNLTRDTMITMNGSDTLILINTTGIDIPETQRGSLSVYPNPSIRAGRIEFVNPSMGRVITKVFDVSGSMLLRDEKFLGQGTHLYNVGGFKSGLYWISVHTETHSMATKWISMNAAQAGTPYLTYESTVSGIPNQARLSGSKNLNMLPCDPGELLLFKGSSGNHSRIVTLMPTQSEVVDFEFITCKDGNNNYYPVVTIGTQTWMAANLKATKYNNNTAIPHVTDPSTWSNISSPSYCWYENDSASYGNKYGALYKWQAAATGNLCPIGWHVPTTTEWNTLATTLGGDTIAGAKLKETGTLHWDSLNTKTTNSSGFSARPGGLRFISNGVFQDEGRQCYFWTSDDYSGSFAHIRSLNYNTNKINAIGNNKGNGLSVRCIKDPL